MKKRKRNPNYKLTPKKEVKAEFIKKLSETGNVTLSSKIAGITRQAAYDMRGADKEFAAAWDSAMDESADVLESEARRRAFEGVEKPVYQGGVMVGTIQEYSDTLLIFLLKGNNPKKFRERVEHTGANGGPIKHEYALDLLK